MATGTVKWFNNAKGYGFVLSENKDEDLFIHYSSIQMDGYKSLKAGQEVLYDVQEGPKGMHAVNIRSTGEQVGETADSSEPQIEDNLHLNPMHSVPKQGQPTADVQKGSEAAPQVARQAEAEVALE